MYVDTVYVGDEYLTVYVAGKSQNLPNVNVLYRTINEAGNSFPPLCSFPIEYTLSQGGGKPYEFFITRKMNFSPCNMLTPGNYEYRHGSVVTYKNSTHLVDVVILPFTLEPAK